jgi:hypothetical protein
MRAGGLPSGVLRRLDTNGDGKLSKDEFAKMADLFDELDRNHDGFLEPAELSGPAPGDAGRPNAGAAPAAGAPAESAPLVTPSDKKPAAGADDSVAGTLSAPATSPAATPAAEAGRKPANAGGAKKGQGPLRKSDTDGDGKISRDEAQGRLKANFAKLDLNSDGFLDSSELRAALATLGPKK